MASCEPDRLLPLSLFTTDECNCGGYFGEGLYPLGKRRCMAESRPKTGVDEEGEKPLCVERQ
ncbi:protein of unknown function [Pseudodesulfovibrio profundus]|uniref:Uncharacterized protein n=1 Tax=Pseudodesulfovibrio profundus TaxID=57320 RepID=A0A2C8FA53_9BACT|nr:protein of unknown function [Pseudodesulfovibrio profundus]